ncbi:hypothetical protein MA16_Dca003899 [Dendrobium catenatum]|uniref:Uncharacterized protein n=1 Tax=Dendrobium catenatum TaxID=906689 RepID=A0A2I0X1T9_9ASPA|nr:hypothetical protein MA16_Dca003899 [Dendrobium catenatum]
MPSPSPHDPTLALALSQLQRRKSGNIMGFWLLELIKSPNPRLPPISGALPLSSPHPWNKTSQGALVIKEVSDVAPKKIIHVKGKGKSIAEDLENVTPRTNKVCSTLNSNDPAASSSRMKIYINRFGNSNVIPGHNVINANSPNLVNKNFHGSIVGEMEDANVDKVTGEMPNRAVNMVNVNP